MPRTEIREVECKTSSSKAEPRPSKVHQNWTVQSFTNQSSVHLPMADDHKGYLPW